MSVPAPRPSTAVVLPVKNGGPLLAEVLEAAASQGADELLVVDSGSTDGSVAVARSAGFTVLEIDPDAFSHGPTRNLAVRETTAEIVCFLTQDATPVPGWLDGYVDAFAARDDVGLAFGPHLPRPDTSPMIAREQDEFWAPFSPDGRITFQHRIDEPGWHPEVASNANAAYRRSALEQVRFRDVSYAEDRAFVIDAFAAGWVKAYQPRAAVLHAHDYPWAQFMRRYFDEYRALREMTGYQMSFYPRGIVRDARNNAASDVTWLDQHRSGVARRSWALRAWGHHAGRRVAGVVAGRAHELPVALQRWLSHEGRAGEANVVEVAQTPADIPSAVPDERVEPSPFADALAPVAEVETHGPLPLAPRRTDAVADRSLRIAMLVPPFDASSVLHDGLFRLAAALADAGQTVSTWIHDPRRSLGGTDADELRVIAAESLTALPGPVHVNFREWRGADVVLATTWETAYVALRLPACGARSVLVRHYEPDAFPAAAERLWAQDVLREDLQVITVGDAVASRVSTLDPASHVALPSIAETRPATGGSVPRRHDTIALRVHAAGADSATPLAALAVAEVVRRRPGLRVVTYGPGGAVPLSFPHRHTETQTAAGRALLYGEATVGVALSLSEGAIDGAAMNACELPHVVLASATDADGTPPTITALADEIERLLVDDDHRAATLTRQRGTSDAISWTEAAEQLTDALRTHLRGMVAR